MVTELTPITRNCRECSQPFVIDAHEQEFFQRLAIEKGGAWRLPARCSACRAERRRAREAADAQAGDGVLVCADCFQNFAFTAADQEYFAERSFQVPRRCPACRAERRLGRAKLGPPDRSPGTETTS